MNKPFNTEGLYPVKFDPNNSTNVPVSELRKQVEANIRRMLPQAQPYNPNPDTVLLVCGGPSLKQTEKELVEAYWKGGKIVAVNGAYQWCIDRNLKPSAMVMLDGRQFNARFVETPALNCKYFLASQCHADAFELCKDRDTYIWHCCSGGDEEYEMLKRYYFERVFPIGDGTTVAIKAIALMTMTGFRNFDIFGLDSCWLDIPVQRGADGPTDTERMHHAYEQKENDRDGRLVTWLRPPGRDDLAQRFECAPWHMQQAADFQKLVHDHGDKFRLNVRGNGLIAATMRLSALLGQTVTPEPGN